MNILELKGELHELIASVQNVQLLVKLKTAFKKVAEIEDIEISENLLTEEQEAELMLALEESYDEKNTITFEEFKKQNAQRKPHNIL